MIIQEDTRQKPSKNADIRKQLEALGHTVRRFGMLCGDYQIFGKGNIVIDTKQKTCKRSIPTLLPTTNASQTRHALLGRLEYGS